MKAESGSFTLGQEGVFQLVLPGLEIATVEFLVGSRRNGVVNNCAHQSTGNATPSDDGVIQVCTSFYGDASTTKTQTAPDERSVSHWAKKSNVYQEIVASKILSIASDTITLRAIKADAGYQVFFRAFGTPIPISTANKVASNAATTQSDGDTHPLIIVK